MKFLSHGRGEKNEDALSALIFVALISVFSLDALSQSRQRSRGAQGGTVQRHIISGNGQSGIGRSEKRYEGQPSESFTLNLVGRTQGTTADRRVMTVGGNQSTTVGKNASRRITATDQTLLTTGRASITDGTSNTMMVGERTSRIAGDWNGDGVDTIGVSPRNRVIHEPNDEPLWANSVAGNQRGYEVDCPIFSVEEAKGIRSEVTEYPERGHNTLSVMGKGPLPGRRGYSVDDGATFPITTSGQVRTLNNKNPELTRNQSIRPAGPIVSSYNPKEIGIDKSVPWQRSARTRSGSRRVY